MKLISNKQIDRNAWDQCIVNSPYPVIYARSWYLDQMCPEWRGLIDEQYDWVMPITARSKLAVHYLFQPSFTQQLGVFASSIQLEIPWQEIRNFLLDRYPFWEVNFHPGTSNLLMKGAEIRCANNFIIDLSRGYELVSRSYHPVFRKNLKRSNHQQLKYLAEKNFETVIRLYQKLYGDRIPHVKKFDYDALGMVCSSLAEQNNIVCRKVEDLTGNVLAMILLLRDENRLYNIMNVTVEAGKRAQSNHYLMDGIIREFSGKPLLLDLEGSDLPGVKKFYESLGAENQPYYQVKLNHLPWPLRLLK